MNQCLTKLFCLASFSLLWSLKVSVDHFAGGEISCKCAANPNMEVALVYYLDCGCSKVEICAGGCGAACNCCQALSSCNSSHLFTNDSVVVINGGDPFVFNNGVLDPERDSKKVFIL